MVFSDAQDEMFHAVQGEVGFMLATDKAARGLDIVGVVVLSCQCSCGNKTDNYALLMVFLNAQDEMVCAV